MLVQMDVGGGYKECGCTMCGTSSGKTKALPRLGGCSLAADILSSAHGNPTPHVRPPPAKRHASLTKLHCHMMHPALQAQRSPLRSLASSPESRVPLPYRHQIVSTRRTRLGLTGATQRQLPQTGRAVWPVTFSCCEFLCLSTTSI